MTQNAEHYILSTGGKDTTRLRLLHEAYGPETRAVLCRAGLRVAEIGCGTGNTACRVGGQLGPERSIFTVDIPPQQI